MATPTDKKRVRSTKSAGVKSASLTFFLNPEAVRIVGVARSAGTLQIQLSEAETKLPAPNAPKGHRKRTSVNVLVTKKAIKPTTRITDSKQYFRERVFSADQAPPEVLTTFKQLKGTYLRPDHFGYTIWGTTVGLTFPNPKLLDYMDRQDELERHDNPFALVVLAHLQSLATRDDADSRRTSKVRLAKNLLNRGLSAEEIRQLFRVIDWVLELPEELSRSFWDEIDEYEKEKQMPVLTSTEKMWLNQGREEGREEGKRDMLLQSIGDYLKAKFGKDGTKLMPAVKEITDLKKLHNMQKKIWAANSLAEVETLLAGKKRR